MGGSVCVRIIRLVAINDRGRHIGEGHHSSRLTDHEVDLMRELYEEHGVGLTELARKFEITKPAVWRIVTYRTRAQTAADFKLMRRAYDEKANEGG